METIKSKHLRTKAGLEIIKDGNDYSFMFGSAKISFSVSEDATIGEILQRAEERIEQTTQMMKEQLQEAVSTYWTYAELREHFARPLDIIKTYGY